MYARWQIPSLHRRVKINFSLILLLISNYLSYVCYKITKKYTHKNLSIFEAPLPCFARSLTYSFLLSGSSKRVKNYQTVLDLVNLSLYVWKMLIKNYREELTSVTLYIECVAFYDTCLNRLLVLYWILKTQWNL